MRRAIKKPAATAPGVITPTDAYTTHELRKRLKWGEQSLRNAKKSGLRVLKYGNTRFVLGSDFISWIETATTPDKETKQ